MSPNGRIVNVSSTMGLTKQIPSETLRAQFKSAETTLTVDELDALMHRFVEDVTQGTWEEAGWPKQAYGISKVGLTAFTKILARSDPTVKEKQLTVVSVCPGSIPLLYDNLCDLISQSLIL